MKMLCTVARGNIKTVKYLINYDMRHNIMFSADSIRLARQLAQDDDHYKIAKYLDTLG